MPAEGQVAQDQYVEEYQLDLENRIRNLLWTISQDYSLEMKPDVSLFLRSKALALYDGIKQGALARFFDREELGLYLVKKVFLQADEASLTVLAQLCVEAAVGDRLMKERPGVKDIQRQAILDILDQEYETYPHPEDLLGNFRLAALSDRLCLLEGRERRKCGIHALRGPLDLLQAAGEMQDTLDLIRLIDLLYNTLADPSFAAKHGNLETVLSVTLQELAENDWRDFLSEDLYEETLENYITQMADAMTRLEDRDLTSRLEEEKKKTHKVKILTQEMLDRAYTYVELNFGRSYLSETDQKRMNYLMCRQIHGDCSLFFTEGILKNPVKHNYQYEYALRLRDKNLKTYHEKYRMARQNITALTAMLKKSLIQRDEVSQVLSDHGEIVPSRLWRIGRTSEAKVFHRQVRGQSSDFVVDVLIDASGSQMSRQGDVALQAYMISAALSNVGLPHRVMSYCTFWDYTILHRFREYEDPKEADENIFSYTASSNNRDGLAIRTVGQSLLEREEEKKILIILSDGRPYDVILNRPNARNPQPYFGEYAIKDTATQVRRLRGAGVSVLGVFAGEEKDLAAERKIFGKDFAYIREIGSFSRIVGRYLTRQLELDT